MRRTLAIAGLVLVALDGRVAAASPQATVFPGASWQEATPESQGVDSVKLKAAVDYLKANAPFDGVNELVVIRNGYLIWKGSNIDKMHGIWSCTKSFTSTVLGLLVEDGKCTLDTKSKDYLSSMSAAYPNVTLRHFTTMTSGYFAVGDTLTTHGQSGTPFSPSSTPLFTPPGSKYAYWDSAMNQFANTLTRIAGEPIEDLFKRRIADPIAMNRAKWDWKDWGAIDGLVVNGGAGNGDRHVLISAREIARLGHLFLNRGKWDGKQLISASWIDAATKNQVPATTPLGHPQASPIDGPGVYGFNWWANGIKSDGTRKWPGAPTATYAASGHNNNDMFVVPDWNMVVVRMGLDEGGTGGFTITDATYSTFLQKVGQALASSPPPPSQAVTGFTLLNADSDLDIGPLDDGATLNLATLPSRNLNVRANTSPALVGSVRFGYDGNASTRTENAAPYALAGDTGGNYNAWTPAVGSHTLTATPYTEAGAAGTAGTARTVRFTVVDQPGSTHQAPQVNAGADQAVTLPSSAALDGTVSDDGQPGPLIVSWSKASGPGTVTFGNVSLADTAASFSVEGSYVLRLTASDGALSASDDVAVTVKPSPSAPQAVTSLTLIDADSDQPVAGFESLPDGALLDLGSLPTRNLNIRANTSPATVGSVRFAYDADADFRTENVAPYALAGDTSGDYAAWTPAAGNHSVTATPYALSGAGGAAGTSLWIAFTVVDGPAASALAAADEGGGCGATGMEAPAALALLALLRRRRVANP